jgi:hypothetical protein
MRNAPLLDDSIKWRLYFAKQRNRNGGVTGLGFDSRPSHGSRAYFPAAPTVVARQVRR